MNPEFKSAVWKPLFYGYDYSLVKGMRDVLFLETDEKFDFRVNHEDGLAVKAIVSSISHPVYGEIKGIYNDGLDLHVVPMDGRRFTVNGEENPGEIVDSDDNEMLSEEPFLITLRNPVETGVSAKQYSQLFFKETRNLLAEFDDARKRRALEIAED